MKTYPLTFTTIDEKENKKDQASMNKSIPNPMKKTPDFSNPFPSRKEREQKLYSEIVKQGASVDIPPKSVRRRKREAHQIITESSLSLIHPICCGIDIHKQLLVACLRKIDEQGNLTQEIRELTCFTDDLFQLKHWLEENECPIVAIESTGVYWRGVHNVLEGSIEVILVNARHFKNVPGRKTDISDSKWLCELLQFGLVRGSYIPCGEVRDWRELTRNRRVLTKNLADYKRRVHKVFETANIKIDSVVSDLFGKTGRNLMRYLSEYGEEITLDGVFERAKGSLRLKTEELYRSLQGFYRDHHRFETGSYLRVIHCLEKEIQEITIRIQSLMRDQIDLLGRLKEIPGIDLLSAQAIISELGYDLNSFANADVLSAWAGVAPGNNQSAGKRYSGKSPVRKHSLKEILIEVAWAAIKKKGSFYKAKYYKLKAKRGAKKAIVAIAHRILKAVYKIIKNGESYQELGESHLETKNKNSKLYRLQKQAKVMGFELTPISSAN